jgi:hypothetical protein
MSDASAADGRSTQTVELAGTGFFRVQQISDRWTFVRPSGGAFLSMGVNHGDETNLKYPYNIDVWRKRYGSRDRWIKEGFVKDLKSWGFNTIGWTQECVSGVTYGRRDWFGEPFDHGHSTPWSAAELRASGMPYVVQMRVAEIEDWKGHPVFPDVFSRPFDSWCAYLARSLCLDHAESSNLLGYFLVDIPAWVPHASGRFFAGFEGLSGDAYDKKLFETATKYYQTITEHIRRADPNHLILGDRYNGNKIVPEPVLEAMKPFVDLLSVQYFCGPTEADRQAMVEKFIGWQRITEKPVVNADIGNWTATKLNPHRASKLASQRERGLDYIASIGALLDQPWFIGWHWCAYLENVERGWGAKDPWDEPYQDFVGLVTEFNKRATREWGRLDESRPQI